MDNACWNSIYYVSRLDVIQWSRTVDRGDLALTSLYGWVRCSAGGRGVAPVAWDLRNTCTAATNFPSMAAA